MHACILHRHIPQNVSHTTVTTNTNTGNNKALYSSYVNECDIFSKCLYNKCLNTKSLCCSSNYMFKYSRTCL